MKKALLAISFSAALITGSLSSPAEASREFCQRTCKGGTKCRYNIPEVYRGLKTQGEFEYFMKTNKLVVDGFSNFWGLAWGNMSLPEQRKYCSACGWGHVRKTFSRNYCDKSKPKGNY